MIQFTHPLSLSDRSGVNASVGACVAIGTLTIVGAMFYLWFRRRRHSRQIQDQETREANLAAVEAGSGPSPFVPVVPAALVKEWRVSDERAWRAELRKELEADVRELKRQDRNKDIDAGEVMMVEDVRKPFKGKDKSPS